MEAIFWKIFFVISFSSIIIGVLISVVFSFNPPVDESEGRNKEIIKLLKQNRRECIHDQLSAVSFLAVVIIIGFLILVFKCMS